MPELASLSQPERLKLNQLRAFAHVNVLGFFAEISVAERLRHAAAETAGDPCACGRSCASVKRG